MLRQRLFILKTQHKERLAKHSRKKVENSSLKLV